MKHFEEMRYRYYQPNAKDPKRKGSSFGDCTIRALSKALELSWIEAFDVAIPLCREFQCSNIFDTPLAIRKQIMAKLGFTYTGISATKGTKRPTVDKFVRLYPSGTYILSLANHTVAVKDGYYYDTWNCGGSCVYGYFAYTEEA